MASRRGNYGRYSSKPSWEQDASAGITSKIICIRCSKVKNKSNFSNSKLQELRNKTKDRRNVNFEAQPFIACRNCIGGAKSEVKCGSCEKYKALDSFARNQRSKGDEEAECITCVTKRISDTPFAATNTTQDEDDADALEYDDLSHLTNSSTVAQGGVRLDQSMGSMSIRGDGSSSSAARSQPMSDQSSHTGQTAQYQPAFQLQRGRGLLGGTSSVLAASNATENSFNRSQYGEPSRSTTGARSTTGRSETSNMTTNKKGFAKVKASDSSADQNMPPSPAYGEVDKDSDDSNSETEYDDF